jgi:RHH-type proline utilization regulon transcriptional repressor/proline dehydrogenase/delta 1-pyrroline-5-carboxylate dehydrogenase
LARAVASDADAWAQEFGREHDPTGLVCESNRFRYRPVERVVIRVAPGREFAARRVVAAAQRCGCATVVSETSDEPAEHLAERIRRLRPGRVRVVGAVEPEVRAVADELGIHVAADPVTASGRIELLHYLREQSISRTMHRYGNVLRLAGDESV